MHRGLWTEPLNGLLPCLLMNSSGFHCLQKALEVLLVCQWGIVDVGRAAVSTGGTFVLFGRGLGRKGSAMTCCGVLR